MAHRKSILDSDTALKDIFRSRIFDFGSHLEITLPDDAPPKLPAQVKFNISAKFGSKPVLFNYNSGWTREWWINGACHHPHDPCVIVGGGQVQQKLYKDENGYPHREDGAAEITRVTNSDGDVYEEFWKISPGIKHRTDGGPASIMVHYENDCNLKVWEDFLSRESRVVIPRAPLQERFSKTWKNRYKDQRPVKHVRKRIQEWFAHGKPERKGDLYTTCGDYDTFEIVQMTNNFNMKIISLTATKEFKWQDENGKLSRHNGPAIIKLYMVEEVNQNGSVSMGFEDYVVEWYHEGIRLPDEDVVNWMVSNNIKMTGGDSILEKTLSPEDEFCFISDFISRVNA